MAYIVLIISVMNFILTALLLDMVLSLMRATDFYKEERELPASVNNQGK